MSDLMKMRIAKQLTLLMIELGATTEMLCVVGSYGDTQSDDDVLDALEQLNTRGTCAQQVVSLDYKWEPKL